MQYSFAKNLFLFLTTLPWPITIALEIPRKFQNPKQLALATEMWMLREHDGEYAHHNSPIMTLRPCRIILKYTQKASVDDRRTTYEWYVQHSTA